MLFISKNKLIIIPVCVLFVLSIIGVIYYNSKPISIAALSDGTDYIKWLDFNVPDTALERALNYDLASYEEGERLDWIKILACLAVKSGGSFKNYKNSDMDKVVEKLKSGKTYEEVVNNSKYYDYYEEGYRAVLGGMVGLHEIEVEQDGKKVMQRKYGLKAFSPIAKNYGYSHCDDFGNSRSYGFKRKHLGNDLMGGVGTPVVAVESGIVEALGWNRYGGWRIGIRSIDGNRYYYYAHLRKDHPYHKSLYEGKVVNAGDVIGYLGMTGYSTKENVNNIRTPHLHFGIQLIFDESQKEGNNEIWIDCYNIVKFLRKNKSAVVKNGQTGDFDRLYNIYDPVVFE